MPSYVSASFEKDYLATSGLVRVITRARDDGSVPPDPSATYYPTDPDTLTDFLVVEYVSDAVGERFVKVAATTDFGSMPVLRLTRFEDASADFVTAGVVAGDTLEITLPDDEIWQSQNYPSGNPFVFSVNNVVSATVLEVSLPFPAFGTTLVWEMPSRAISGVTGATRRATSPVPLTQFLDSRYNGYFTSAVAAENFVAATKADMAALATEETTNGLVDESYTGASSV